MVPKERVKKLWTILEPYANEHGFEIIELEFSSYGRTPVLRVYIDTSEDANRKVSIDDCASVSQVFSNVLDTVYMEEESYILEVSSPGFDRPLRREKDFLRYKGEMIKVQTEVPVEGRKVYKGILEGIEEGMVILNIDGNLVRIHLENLKRANLIR
ncbi:MAG: ribosome maturation factor RimP [Candidatus Hydrogenedentes bacterium]|nr:ribosome maturation factor RimP [Candidatus Hydrogenedentota bacterium]